LADESILFSEEEKYNFNKVTKWITKSAYPALVQELQGAEKILESAKKDVKKRKEQISRLMNEGLSGGN